MREEELIVTVEMKLLARAHSSLLDGDGIVIFVALALSSMTVFSRMMEGVLSSIPFIALFVECYFFLLA